MPDESFFSCDWGTSSFRLRGVQADGVVIAERREAVGARDLFAQTAPDDAEGRAAGFAAFLREQLRVLAPDQAWGDGAPQVVVSGMASSSIGWRELPYASVPFALDGSTARTEGFDLDMGPGGRARILLVSGLATDDDVMRGEETELLGLFAQGAWTEVAEDGVVILPGTHSKHVVLSRGVVIGFRTYMTGELFEALAGHTVLGTSVGDARADDAALLRPEDLSAFRDAAQQSAELGLAKVLFKVRSRGLLGAVDPASNRCALRGMLIGAELAGLAELPATTKILLAAGPSTADAYRFGCEALGLGHRVVFVAPGEVALAAVRGQRLLLNRLRPRLR